MARILADTTNKRLLAVFFFLSIIMVVTVPLIGILTIPSTFVELTGKQHCNPNGFVKGLCHQIDLNEQSIWLSYIGRLYPSNQMILVGGKAIQNHNTLDLDFELDYEIYIKPVSLYGKDHADSEDFKESRKHRMRVKCKENQMFCE